MSTYGRKYYQGQASQFFRKPQPKTIDWTRILYNFPASLLIFINLKKSY